MPSEALLEIDQLGVHFPVSGGLFLRTQALNKAVDGVSLTLGHSETLGLVGESGCGKSTLGKATLGLYRPNTGTITFAGTDITAYSNRQLKPLRRQMQMIFQDPADSLNDRHTVGQILSEPFIIHNMGSPAEREKKMLALLDVVSLPKSARDKYPFEFSGGQRQRIGIARAIALEPQLVVCDEPVSALDVSIQSQIINLLLDLQASMSLSYLFIAHDLAVVKAVSDRIAVMYLGRIVEVGPANSVYKNASHPYTRALVASIPNLQPGRGKTRQVLTGEVPSPINPPVGCAFHTRCPYAQEQCQMLRPQLRKIASDGQMVACHLDF